VAEVKFHRAIWGRYFTTKAPRHEGKGEKDRA
jgi:hypothetical protein